MLGLVAEHLAAMTLDIAGARFSSLWLGFAIGHRYVHMHDPMEHGGAVGSPLRERREALELSREALGAAAGGISSTTIWRLENGTVRPHRSTLAAIARALGVTAEDITPTKSGGSPTKATAAEKRGKAPRHESTYSIA
jgi:transcriptional regulator with XRE-family HTH domain